MSLLSNLASTITGDKRTTEEALAVVGWEIKALENWMQNTVKGSDGIRAIVGKERIASDPLIYEKGLNLIIRLQDTLDVKWEDTLGADLHRVSINFLALKYALAAGEGLQFNQANAGQYPITAKLASLDLTALNLYFQEAFESTQELYKKYF